MRSLYSGVTGMRNHQTRMDVIGNNISNVNTLGFKSGRVNFQEALVQGLRGASRPTATRGGINPVQIGLGMEVGSIDTMFGQGALENTGRATDLALQGDGFFVVGSGSEKFYTRVGNFSFDAEGNMVGSSNGLVLQGTMADANGDVPPLGVLGDIRIPMDLQSPAQATTTSSLIGNIDASAAVGDTVDMQVTVYDSLGTQQVVTLTFTKTAANAWDWAATDPSGAAAGNGEATFNPDGSLATFDDGFGGQANVSYVPTTGADPMSIDLSGAGTGALDGLTQFSEPSTAYARADDGYTYGTLDEITVDESGYVYGAFTNGEVRVLAQLAVGRFTNMEGLNRIGDGLYQASPNSGSPNHFYASDVGDVSVASGALEMSNVELTREFTDMITTQRGFQANARVITVSDEMLLEVANLKR